MARSAEDCALLLGAMSGFDPRDSTSAERPPQDFHARCSAARRRIAASRCTACASACRRSSSPAALARRRRRRACAPRSPSCERLGATLVDVQPAAHRAVDPGLLHHRAGRGVVEPVALRRRALRPPRRSTTATCSTCTRRRRSRRLRRRGQAPHHDRHLRAVARLLRRLLPAGAEAPPHDRRRLPGRASAQCDVIAGPVAPTRGLGARRARATTRSPTTWPTSSRCRRAWPGLPGMSVPAGFGERRHAGGPAAHRQLLRRRRSCCTRRTRFQQATDWHRARRRQATDGDRARRATLIRGYEVVIGLETHAQLSTALEDLQRRVDRVRRRAEHAGLAGRPRAARHAAGAEPRRGRARDPLRPGGRRARSRRAVDLRAQELLLPRPAQGLPDQPVRDAGGAGRHGRVLRSATAKQTRAA